MNVAAGPSVSAAKDETDPPTSGDRPLYAMMGRVSLGVSPAALGLAYADWAFHLAASPGNIGSSFCKRRSEKASGSRSMPRKAPRIRHLRRVSNPFPRTVASAARRGSAGRTTRSTRRSFSISSGGTTQQPASAASRSTTNRSSLSSRASFSMRSRPSTSSRRTPRSSRPRSDGGQNLLRVRLNFLADWERAAGAKPPVGGEAFRPGEHVAVTAGEVVYRNRLIELIQYSPKTKQVRADPILIVPAWIMNTHPLTCRPAIHSSDTWSSAVTRCS